MKILVVDDEPSIATFVASELRIAGYAMKLVEDCLPQLIILDVMLPGRNGFSVCQAIRKVSHVPIIMLSARRDERDKIKALELGADDYMTKPFGIGELLARIKAAIRRSYCSDVPIGSDRFVSERLIVDYSSRRIFVDGLPLKLTATEFKLLCILVRQPGKTILHDTILSSVWGPQYAGQVEHLWVYVGRLRKKIERDPEHRRCCTRSRASVTASTSTPTTRSTHERKPALAIKPRAVRRWGPARSQS